MEYNIIERVKKSVCGRLDNLDFAADSDLYIFLLESTLFCFLLTILLVMVQFFSM